MGKEAGMESSHTGGRCGCGFMSRDNRRASLVCYEPGRHSDFAQYSQCWPWQHHHLISQKVRIASMTSHGSTSDGRPCVKKLSLPRAEHSVHRASRCKLSTCSSTRRSWRLDILNLPLSSRPGRSCTHQIGSPRTSAAIV